ncbi:MAG: AAA family ATPase, partial [Acidobacteria bacterium]|nr:AAA family ATPase [Acidobacteriota bacterium]
LAARIANQKPLVGHVLQAGDTVESAAKRQRFTLERTHCGRVVFASWEDEYQEVGRRLAAMAQDGLVNVKGLKDRLLYLDLRGMGAAWAPGSQKHVQTVAGLTKVGRRLRATVESLDARLLVLDSLAGAYASDENVRPLVRAFCSDWDAWGTKHRCAVLLIAHPPKRSARSTGSTSDEDTDDDFAGSTDWHNAVRWRWSLGNANTTYRRVQKGSKSDKAGGHAVSALALTCQKSSYGQRPDQTLFLGPADAGKIGFKVISPGDAARQSVRRLPGWKLKDEGTGNAEEYDPDAIR